MTICCIKLDLLTDIFWHWHFMTIASFLYFVSTLPLVERLRNNQDRCVIHAHEHQIIIGKFFKTWSDWLMWCRIQVFDRWNISFKFPIWIVCWIGVRKLVISNVSSSSASTFGTKKTFFVINDDWFWQVLRLDIFPRIIWLESIIRYVILWTIRHVLSVEEGTGRVIRFMSPLLTAGTLNCFLFLFLLWYHLPSS